MCKDCLHVMEEQQYSANAEKPKVLRREGSHTKGAPLSMTETATLPVFMMANECSCRV